LFDDHLVDLTKQNVNRFVWFACVCVLPQVSVYHHRFVFVHLNKVSVLLYWQEVVSFLLHHYPNPMLFEYFRYFLKMISLLLMNHENQNHEFQWIYHVYRDLFVDLLLLLLFLWLLLWMRMTMMIMMMNVNVVREERNNRNLHLDEIDYVFY